MFGYVLQFRLFEARLHSLLVFGSLFVLLFVSSPIAASPNANIIHVKPGASDGASGADWDHARGLQGALGAAVAGDEIWVASGVYYPNSSGHPFYSFQLKNGVAIYGGFVGTETQKEKRDPVSHVTVLSGDIDNNDTHKTSTGVITSTDDLVGSNSYNVVVADNTDSSAVLDGFTITGGEAINLGQNPCLDCGAGLRMVQGNATLTSLTFSGNKALTGGGGIYLYMGSPTLTHITFTGNAATSGGGMFIDEHSNPSLTNVTFSSNHADSFAGGMFNHGGSKPLLKDVTFSSNSSTYDGGGMANNVVSSPTLTNVSFSSNHAGRNGGGIYDTDGSNPTLVGATFSANQAISGGGIYNNISSPILTSVAFNCNRAVDGNGGGMFTVGGDSILTNVSFSGNWASNIGGGVVLSNTTSDPRLIDVLFSGNRSPNDGGALYLYKSNARFTNGTLSGNFASHGSEFYDIGGYLVFTNTIMWKDGEDPQVLKVAPGQGSIGESFYRSYSGPGSPDPQFVRPVNCGDDGCADDPAVPGDQSLNDDYGDLRLQPASPAIDSGYNKAVAGVATDLAGQLRIVAAKILPAIVDIGAYEAGVAPPIANAGGPYSGTEGSPVVLNNTSQDDGGIAAYTWDCTNDGKVDVSVPPVKVNSCTYPKYGTFTLRVNVTDTVNATGTATSQVIIASVAPDYTPPPNQSSLAGSTKAFILGSYTDVGADGSWRVTVDWGDGSTNSQFDSTQTGDLPDKNHTYASMGSYNAVVTVNDGEAKDSAGFEVTVNAPPAGAPKATAPAAQNALPGASKSFALGSFTDPGSSGPWQVTVDWGDGLAPTHFSVAKDGQLPAKTHIYTSAAAFDVTVTVSDGQLSGSSTFQVTVGSAPNENATFLPSVQNP